MSGGVVAIPAWLEALGWIVPGKVWLAMKDRYREKRRIQRAITGEDAIRIARKAIAERFNLELVQFSGASRMLPRERNGDGAAAYASQLEASHVYNWLAAHHATLGSA